MPMNYSTARSSRCCSTTSRSLRSPSSSGSDDIYRIRFSDRRDGRTHTILEAQQVATWLDSVFAGRVLQPDYGVCEVCDSPPRRARLAPASCATSAGRCLVELLEDGLGGEQI